MFYTSFTIDGHQFHYKIRARTMAEALQRISDFYAGVQNGNTKRQLSVEAMSVKTTRGIAYEEGF